MGLTNCRARLMCSDSPNHREDRYTFHRLCLSYHSLCHDRMSTPSKYHNNVSLRKKRQDIRKHFSDPEQKRGSKEQHFTRRRNTESGVYAKGMSLYLFVLFIKKSPLANAGAPETCRSQSSMTNSMYGVQQGTCISSFDAVFVHFLSVLCCAAL